MKKQGHPDYQQILFEDTSTGAKFICGASMTSEETETVNGKEYPLVRVAISSASHPFYTGSEKMVDSEGRVSKFQNRYKRKAAVTKEEDED